MMWYLRSTFVYPHIWIQLAIVYTTNCGWTSVNGHHWLLFWVVNIWASSTRRTVAKGPAALEVNGHEHFWYEQILWSNFTEVWTITTCGWREQYLLDKGYIDYVVVPSGQSWLTARLITGLMALAPNLGFQSVRFRNIDKYK